MTKCVATESVEWQHTVTNVGKKVTILGSVRLDPTSYTILWREGWKNYKQCYFF